MDRQRRPSLGAGLSDPLRLPVEQILDMFGTNAKLKQMHGHGTAPRGLQGFCHQIAADTRSRNGGRGGWTVSASRTGQVASLVSASDGR